MSNHRIHLIAALSAIALFGASLLTAQTNAGTKSQGQAPATPTSSLTTGTTSSQAADTATKRSDDSTSVKRATDDAEQSTLANLKGKRIRSSSGSELGKVHDFIVDGSSGRIVHVVVSTGGLLGLGDKLRLVSPASVKQSAEGLTVEMQQSDFRALPTITAKEMNAGNFAAYAGSSQPDRPASIATSHGQLVRASQLKDKSIRSDDHEVGEIEHIVVDLQSGTVMAMIDAKESFAGQSGDFLVPFNKLEIRSADADSITTSLLRSDFPEQRAATAQASSPSPSSSTAASPSTTTSTSEIAGASTTISPPSTDKTSSSPSSPSALAASTSDSSSTSSGTGRSTAADHSPERNISSATAATNSASGVATVSSSPSTSGASTPTRSPDNITDDTTPASSRSTSAGSSQVASSSPSSSTAPDAIQSRGILDTPNASSGVVTPIPSPLPTDEQLTPTGRSSADQTPSSVVSAMAIRQALDADPTLAREDVTVKTKIVLEGTVQSEEAKKRVEEIVKKNAASAEIDNQITIKKK